MAVSQYWPYSPNQPAAIAFCVLYALLSAGHFFFRFWKGCRFVNALAVGGLCESYDGVASH
jgi:hypothetical protein